MSSPFNTKYLHSIYSKNASLSIGFYDGAVQMAAFPRNSDSKKPIASVKLTDAACALLGHYLSKIMEAPPETTLSYVQTYRPRDGGDPKPSAVINIFKDDKNRIGIEVTNPNTQKSASFLIRAPQSFSMGEGGRDSAAYEYETKVLAKFFNDIAPWAKILSPREKRDDNSGSRGSSSGGSESRSSSRDNDELW